jgi:hypothetical protein
VPLIVQDLARAKEPFHLAPENFSDYYDIGLRKEDDGWHADLRFRQGRFGGYELSEYHWTVPTKEINALCEDETPPDASPPALRRGPKGYGADIWELFKARFYVKLDIDGVRADANINDINIDQRVNDLMLWGQNHPEVGEEKTPGRTAMQGKVKEWLALWKLLGVSVPNS